MRLLRLTNYAVGQTLSHRLFGETSLSRRNLTLCLAFRFAVCFRSIESPLHASIRCPARPPGQRRGGRGRLVHARQARTHGLGDASGQIPPMY